MAGAHGFSASALLGLGVAAKAVVTITETLSPPSDTFEQGQVAQLEALARALHAATGR